MYNLKRHLDIAILLKIGFVPKEGGKNSLIKLYKVSIKPDFISHSTTCSLPVDPELSTLPGST